MSRVVIVLPDLRGGGAERVNLDLGREFNQRGHDVEFVVLRAQGELLAEAQAVFPIVSIRVDRLRSVPLALARYLRRYRPDALLASIWPLTVVAPLARALSGHHCTVVVAEHNTLSTQYRGWGRYHEWLLRLSLAVGHRIADARVGVSRGVLEDMSNMAWLNPQLGHVIHNPIPRRQVQSDSALAMADAEWGGSRGEVRILSVGSLTPQKNHRLLLRAFARLDSPKPRLMLLGRGGEEAILRTAARDLGLQDRVIFCGFRRDPTPFYATADLFVLSSDYEGFGNVIVESLAAGTPVVSTNCPSGPAEVLGNGRWGRLVPPGNVEALANAMQEALSAEHDRNALRQRAAEFAPTLAAEKYLGLLLPGRSGAQPPHARSV